MRAVIYNLLQDYITPSNNHVRIKQGADKTVGVAHKPRIKSTRLLGW